MKNILSFLLIAALVVSCGEKKEKKDGFEVNRSKKEETKKEVSEGVQVDMSNKGIGPIKSISFPAEIDTEMAAVGEGIFTAKCTACHLPDSRLLGPAVKGVFDRRSPEWVMKMLLNPTEMLRDDPIAQALLKEYNNLIMTDSNLSEDEARALAEYMRSL